MELTDALVVAGFPDGPATDMLSSGTRAVIEAGPRNVEGGTWYQVSWSPGVRDHVGWVRVDIASALASVGDSTTCPDTADGLLAMLAWDRVRCFGDSPVGVSVEGTVGHCQGGVVLAEPGWLAYRCWEVSDGTGTMGIHAAPESGIVFPDDRVRARMTGHFDDPASSTCVYVDDPDSQGLTPSAAEQVFLCREAFVVDSFVVLEVLGPSTGG